MPPKYEKNQFYIPQHSMPHISIKEAPYIIGQIVTHLPRVIASFVTTFINPMENALESVDLMPPFVWAVDERSYFLYRHPLDNAFYITEIAQDMLPHVIMPRICLLSTRLGPTHPAMVVLQNKLQELLTYGHFLRAPTSQKKSWNQTFEDMISAFGAWIIRNSAKSIRFAPRSKNATA